jgi:hypothetical protein
MLEVAGATPDSHSEIDWRKFQLDSEEHQAVKGKLHQLQGNYKPVNKMDGDNPAYKQFTAPLTTRMNEV